jgi:hypothetical protein
MPAAQSASADARKTTTVDRCWCAAALCARQQRNTKSAADEKNKVRMKSKQARAAAVHVHV